MQKLIAKGAEARLFLGDYLNNPIIIKDRLPKSYRLKELDERLRGFRTRREAKVLDKLNRAGFKSPKVISCDGNEKILMEKIDGILVKEIPERNFKKICIQIGENVAIMHNEGIIHGDLTTSNMILKENPDAVSGDVYFIDFGLSFFSEKAEDRAVDIHLFKEALESKHSSIWKKCFDAFLQSYEKKAEKSRETLKRLENVEKRGRYRAKKGN